MMRALVLSLFMTVSAMVSVSQAAVRTTNAIVENLDASRVDFTLFVKLNTGDEELRITDTGNPAMSDTIKALQKSYNASLEGGEPVKVQIQFNEDLVILSAAVKK